MARFIGIDVGSSFLKAAALDLENRELRRIQRVAMPEFLGGLPAGHREADPEAVMSAVYRTLDALLEGIPRCDGVVLCGQMQGFVLVNARGEAISNYVSWLDGRVTAAEFEDLKARISPEDRADLANELRPDIALPLLWWLKNRGRLPAEPSTPVSLADFVAGRLCGTVPAMEPTQAGAFGALSLRSLHWRHDILARLGLDGLRWPEICRSGSIVGRWRGAPCFAAVGDQQCALAGALLSTGELSVNVGTGAQVSAIRDTLPAVAPAAGQLRPYFNGRYLRTITHLPGGRSLQALLELFTELGGAGEEVWPALEAAVMSLPSTDLRASLAFHPGPAGSAGFLANLHEGNLTVAHVFRAALESMAASYASFARQLDGGGFPGGVVFSGGVARRWKLLRDSTAADLGLRQRLSPHPEDTLFGLLVLARSFSGM